MPSDTLACIPNSKPRLSSAPRCTWHHSDRDHSVCLIISQQECCDVVFTGRALSTQKTHSLSLRQSIRPVKNASNRVISDRQRSWITKLCQIPVGLSKNRGNYICWIFLLQYRKLIGPLGLTSGDDVSTDLSCLMFRCAFGIQRLMLAGHLIHSLWVSELQCRKGRWFPLWYLFTLCNISLGRGILRNDPGISWGAAFGVQGSRHLKAKPGERSQFQELENNIDVLEVRMSASLDQQEIARLKGMLAKLEAFLSRLQG